MEEQQKRALIIKRASVISLAGNFVLAAGKIVTGLEAGSLAVVGDGIDTSVDVAISLMTLVVSGIIAKPADAGHPWGHGKAETMATAGLSFILFFAGLQLSINALGRLLPGTAREVPGTAAVIVTLVSIAGKLLLAFNQYSMGKRAKSSMLKANAQNMAADVIISLAVLAGLVLSVWLGMGFIDSIAALLVGFWVIKAAAGIFRDANTELMDGGSAEGNYKEVFDAVRSVPGAFNPHRTRIRRIAGYLDITLDIEVDGGLTVREAHNIAGRVEWAIKERLESVYDIIVHIEPAGDINNEKNEAYGLKESSLDIKG